MRLWQCEFCEKWDFEYVNFFEKWDFEKVNFVENENLKLWILWKMRFSNGDFCQKMGFWKCELGEKWKCEFCEK